MIITTGNMERTAVTAPPRRTRIAVALALATCVALLGMLVEPHRPTLSTVVTGDAALAARVRPYLQGAFDRVSVATIDGDTVTSANFGATDDTEYEIGSITKTFTALLLADAIERGEVTPDTRVGDLLPLSGSPVADVTLAELASHRSGLPRQSMRLRDVMELALLYLANRDPYVQDVAGVIAQARAARLRSRGRVSYSNLGTALLGQALAAVSSMDYALLVEERIFTPLGMTTSSVPVTAGNLPGDAPTGYSVGGERAAPWTMNGTAPAGGIRSTPADMVRYARALLDGTAPGLDALTPHWAAFGDRLKIGYAWVTEERDGRVVTWHTGETGGFASMLVLDRANHRAVVILANTTEAPVHDIGMMLIGDQP
ncbi:MAG TPA: serine hydrolase domain-containing protein [Herpetosiphonaceae bacterium]|nr:serine hydrolase domain-containing protein [Herpetosiphonaceae bacterium]